MHNNLSYRFPLNEWVFVKQVFPDSDDDDPRIAKRLSTLDRQKEQQVRDSSWFRIMRTSTQPSAWVRKLRELADDSAGQMVERLAPYDIIGISSIVMNVGKVREMCRLIRQISPQSTIVVGGHVAAMPGLDETIDADHIVRGEGVAWMRAYLGESTDAPVRHPAIVSGFGQRALGVKAEPGDGFRAATIIPSVGCPLGCNFCATSEFFGGKGNFHSFYDSGRELFEVMQTAERRERVRTFFIMDENFLLHRRRALELLELMKKHGKSWSLYVFSSASAIRKYTMEELVALGVSWVWMGLESPNSSYAKLRHVDTRELVAELQRNGVKVLGSTIARRGAHAA